MIFPVSMHQLNALSFLPFENFAGPRCSIVSVPVIADALWAVKR